MIIQNTTGRKTYIQIGKRSHELPAGATWTVSDDGEAAFRDARRLEEQGHILIIEAPKDRQVFGSRTLPANGTITFSGAGAEDDTIVLGGRTYGLSADGSYPAQSVGVDIGGTAAETAENLAAAVNADTQQTLVKATAVGAVVYLAHKTNGKSGSQVALDASDCPNATASGATLDDGVYGAAFGAVVHTKIADGGDVVLNTGLSDVSHFIVQVCTSAGALKAYSGAVTATDGVIVASANAEIANNDRVTFLVFG